MTEITTIPQGKIKLTLAEYLDLPDDGMRYEIYDGDLFMTPAPTPQHQSVSTKLVNKLFIALQETGKGRIFHAPIDVLLDTHTIVQPDLVFVKKEHFERIGPRAIEGAPDLVIEILSPSTRRRDVLTKSGLYSRFGVPEYWMVDPEVDRLDVYRLENGIYALAGSFSSPATVRLPGYPEIELEWLFDR